MVAGPSRPNTGPMSEHEQVLKRAHDHATSWLESLDTRPVPPQVGADAVADALGRDLPDESTDAEEVVDLLASACEPGLVAMPSGRFFGFVIGGSHPAALAADWLVSAWDQNAAMRQVTPATAAAEEVAGSWLLDLLGLPSGAAVGFATGATMANFTGIAAGRDSLLRKAGWDVSAGPRGRPGGARARRGGATRLGGPRAALRRAARTGARRCRPRGAHRARCTSRGVGEPARRPTLVLLQAGNLHSGAFDPFDECVRCATSTTHGCTSTARSGCGRPPRRRTGI